MPKDKGARRGGKAAKKREKAKKKRIHRTDRLGAEDLEAEKPVYDPREGPSDEGSNSDCDFEDDDEEGGGEGGQTRRVLDVDLIPSSPLGFLAYATDELLQKVEQTGDLAHCEAMLKTVEGIEKSLRRNDESCTEVLEIINLLLQLKVKLVTAGFEKKLAEMDRELELNRELKSIEAALAMMKPPLSSLLAMSFAKDVSHMGTQSLYSRIVQVSTIAKDDMVKKYVQPVTVVSWDTFNDDVRIGELPSHFDVKIERGNWPVVKDFDCGASEATALHDFSDGVFQGIRRTYEKVGEGMPPVAGTDRLLVDPSIRVVLGENTWMAGRVDATWTRSQCKADNKGLTPLSTFRLIGSGKRMVFLVHEHKAHWAFPYAPPPDYIEMMDGLAEARDERNKERDKRRASLESQGIDWAEVEQAEKASGQHRRKRRGAKSSQSSSRSTQRSTQEDDDDENDDENDEGKDDLSRIQFTQQLDIVGLWQTFEDENRHQHLYRFVGPIIQVYTYMIHSALKYAVLSTTANTWFLRRDQDGTLEIAGPFGVESKGKYSTRYAYFGMVGLALADEESVGYGISRNGALYANMKADGNPSVHKFADGLAGVNSNLRATLSSSESLQKDFALLCKHFDANSGTGAPGAHATAALMASLARVRGRLPLAEGDFQIPMSAESCETLVFSNRMVVDRCNTVGIPMICKRWVHSFAPRRPEENEAAEAAFKREWAMYEGPLSPLQGLSVPLLIYAGSWAFQPYVLAVSDEGDSLEALMDARMAEVAAEAAKASSTSSRAIFQPLLDAHFLAALDALQALHGCGVLHGDVSARNIVVHPSRGVKFIDFEMSEECDDPDTFKYEVAALFMLFNQTPESAAALEHAAAGAGAGATGAPRLKKKRSWRSMPPSLSRRRKSAGAAGAAAHGNESSSSALETSESSSSEGSKGSKRPRKDRNSVATDSSDGSSRQSSSGCRRNMPDMSLPSP